MQLLKAFEELLFIVAFASMRTSGLPVSEAGGAGGAGSAEFPGNILEGHGEGRIPGRVGPETSEDSQPGNSVLLLWHAHHCHNRRRGMSYTRCSCDV